MPDDPPTLYELQRAIDERTLLPGEDPSSSLAEDAVHWIRVYAELIAVKASLIDRAEQARHGLSDDAVKDLDLDQRLFSAQFGRYKARHEYWLRRVADLANGNLRGRHQRSLDLHVQASGSADDGAEPMEP